MPQRRIHPATTAEELRAELEGTLKFIWKHNRGTDEKAAKARTVAVIDLLKRHLDDLGVKPSLTRSLDDLYLAFAEAKRGRLVALFAPTKVGHRLPMELSRLFAVTRAALAIDLLMAGKQSKEKAAREVATKLRQHNFPIEGKLDVPDWRTVVGWREKLRKARGHPDVIWYGKGYLLERKSLLALVTEKHVDPRVLAERQLEMIRQSVQGIG
jgi:hypothetical protein